MAVRVTPAGHKSWTLFYRHNGRLRRLTGRYPDLGLADARKAATRERGRIVDGADPAAERQDERATYGDTVGALFDVYKSKNEKRKSWPEQRRIFENEVLPSWRHRRIADITRRDIRELIDRKATSAPIMANTHGHAPVADRAKKAAAIVSRGLTFTFRAHDLRRTAASYMAEAGVDRMHIAHVLNHRSVTRSTVTAIYDRYHYDKEKRAALETWARELDRIVTNKAGLALVRKTRGVRPEGTAVGRR